MIAGRRLEVPTSESTQLLDITARLQAEVTTAGLRHGRLHLQSLHPAFGFALDERLGHPATALPVCTVLVERGKLVLGHRQAVLAVELDGPGRRQVALQLDGDFQERPRDASCLVEGITPTDRQLVEMELGRQLLVDPEPVRGPMRRLAEAGGKRVRPLLAMLTCRLGPRRDPLRAAALGAAIELLHDATLVHDDYVDQAGTRRGRPTVAVREGAMRAVAVGDYYFAKAVRIIAELGEPDVTTTIAEAVETICLAQIDDVRLRGTYPGDRDQYLRVVRGKTAALFAAACQAGAQLGGASPETADRVRCFGELLGIGFQMADDLLDYSDRSGKPSGLDIRQRAISLPLIYAADHPEFGARVRELLDGQLDEETVHEVQVLVVRSGALRRVGEEAKEVVAAAVRELEEIEGLDAEPVRRQLAGLARSAVDRVR
jgi:geranylgeranyl pyrophosphate synthase/thiamine phosphate synthase YjbQ (UPF0047 family)